MSRRENVSGARHPSHRTEEKVMKAVFKKALDGFVGWSNNLRANPTRQKAWDYGFYGVVAGMVGVVGGSLLGSGAVHTAGDVVLLTGFATQMGAGFGPPIAAKIGSLLGLSSRQAAAP